MSKRTTRRDAALAVAALALVLAACGSGRSSNQAPGSWSAVASMRTPREGGGAGLGTLAATLPDGRVLVAGGYGTRNGKFELAAKNFLKTAEIYDPVSDSWKQAGSMHTARFGGTVLALPKSGQVLAAGGSAGNDEVISPSAEIFDPVSGTWAFLEPMSTCRVSAASTVLAAGDVLLIGGAGCDGKAQASSEIFHHDTQQWSSVAAMHEPRWGHSATTLADGRILVTGGRASAVGADTEQVLASAEVYDPAADTWTAAPPLHVPRVLHAAALLASGQVVVAGGHSQDPADSHSATATAELYAPAAGAWTMTGPMNAPREEGGSMLLRDGTMLMAGGGQQASVELFDPSTGAWSLTSPMKTVHDDAPLTMLPDGDVLIVGGFQMSPGHYRNTDIAERFHPAKR